MIESVNIEALTKESNELAELLNSMGKLPTPLLSLAMLSVGIAIYKRFTANNEELVNDIRCILESVGETFDDKQQVIGN